MPIYTVIGIYEDNHQRYADTVEADSPEEAERIVENSDGPRVMIAGTVEGCAKVVL